MPIPLAAVTILVLLLPSIECARSRANARDIPVCYYDNVAESNGYTQCSNPLYKRCNYWLCCGPDHYCCSPDGRQNSACCREKSLNTYEITGIVTGVIAWVGNIIVILTCITPQILRAVKRRFFKNSNKVVPRDMDGAIEMKHLGKNF